MEFITDWARQLAAYLLLGSVMENLVQKTKYQKYVKLISGIILILLLTQPLFRILGQNHNYEFYLSKYLLENVAADSSFLNEIGEIRNRVYLEELNSTLKKRTEEIVMNYGMETETVQISFSDEEKNGRPVAINLELIRDEEDPVIYAFDSPQVVRLREYLAYEFNLKTENISISVRDR